MIVCRFPQWLPHWTSVPHWSALVTTIIWWCVLFQEWWIVDSWVLGATIRDYLSLLATIWIHWTHDNKMLQEENYPTIHPSLSLSSIHQQINLPTSRLLRGSKTSPGVPVALFVEWYFISQKCLLPLGIFFLLRNKCFFHNIWKRDCLCTVPQKETSRSLSSG